MKCLVDLITKEQARGCSFARFIGVVERTIAQKPVELVFGPVLFVDMHLIPLVQLVQFICADSSMQMNGIFMLGGFGTCICIVKLVYIVFVIIFVVSPIVRFIFFLRFDWFCLLLIFNFMNLDCRRNNFFFGEMNVNKVFYYMNLSAKICCQLFYKGFFKETFIVFFSNKDDVT